MNAPLLRWSRRLPFLCWGSAILGVALAVALEHRGHADPNPRKSTVNLVLDNRPVQRDGTMPASFAPTVKKVTPSVVQVNTATRLSRASVPGGPGLDESMPRFFNPFRELPNRPSRPMPMPRQEGVGSGVLVTADGYILTNNHVVDSAEEVKVTLQDGREFTAKVVGRDPNTDVGVLKIEGTDLPFLPMADSEQVEVGDLVLAVGNPFGIGQTVTLGMVSATGRASIGLDYEDFIQTDAAINPGNSGGALVDAQGRLIGINTAILSRSGGNQGIGFAIPTHLARRVMEDLVEHGRVSRGYIGAMVQEITPALARKFDLKEKKRGALIGDVTPDGPADKAGLQSGDIVLQFDGKPVENSRQFRLQVAQTRPGTQATLEILRDGEPEKLEVRLQERPESRQFAGNDRNTPDDNGTLNGVTVGNLDSRTRQELQAPNQLQGAVVSNVEPSSPAYEAGLRPGDVILEINRKPVRDADDAVRLTEKEQDKTTLLRVWREGTSRFVVVDETRAG